MKNLLAKVLIAISVSIALCSCSNSLSNKNGLYKSSFPNLSIELQERGKVFVTPKQGSGNTFYCITKGSWSEKSETSVNIMLDANENCPWLEDLSGPWNIEKCSTYEGNPTWCISKGNYKLIKQ